MIVGSEHQLERHALLALADLSTAVNVKERYRGNILAGRRDSLLQFTAGCLFRTNERKVAIFRSKLGNRSEADRRIRALGKELIVKLAHKHGLLYCKSLADLVGKSSEIAHLNVAKQYLCAHSGMQERLAVITNVGKLKIERISDSLIRALCRKEGLAVAENTHRKHHMLLGIVCKRQGLGDKLARDLKESACGISAAEIAHGRIYHGRSERCSHKRKVLADRIHNADRIALGCILRVSEHVKITGREEGIEHRLVVALSRQRALKLKLGLLCKIQTSAGDLCGAQE